MFQIEISNNYNKKGLFEVISFKIKVTDKVTKFTQNIYFKVNGFIQAIGNIQFQK